MCCNYFRKSLLGKLKSSTYSNIFQPSVKAQVLYEKMKTFMEKYVYPAEQVSGTCFATVQIHGIFDLKKGFPLTLKQFMNKRFSCSCSFYYKGFLVFIEFLFNITFCDIWKHTGSVTGVFRKSRTSLCVSVQCLY